MTAHVNQIGSQQDPVSAELVDALVDEQQRGAASSMSWVICPAAASVLTPKPLRHTTCCALFQTSEHTVWMLRSVGHVWTEERLAAAAALLSSIGEPTALDPALGTRLAYALELPSVAVLRPVLERVESSHWNTRNLAVALRMQHLPKRGPSPEPTTLSAEVESIERRITSALRSAIRRFVDGLDRDVISLEPRILADTDLYNYLVRQPHRRNRLQLASTFPLFLRTAATGDPAGAGGEIRRAVDTGLPLVKTLSRRWAVSPSVLRGLRHRPADVVGTQWESNIPALVAALNALPAEFRPEAEPATWQAFNRHVEFSESLFGRRPWTSPLALAWLRHAARRGWTKAAVEQARSEFGPGSIATVDGLRRALIETLTAESGSPAAGHDGAFALVVRVSNIVDRYLSAIAPRRLTDLAERYRRELALARSELSDDMAFVLGARFWPVLAEEYVSGDGSRRVVSLATADALMLHGRVLGNCLGQTSLAHYATACLRGEVFVVGILDAMSRTPLSTAELRATKADPGLRYRIRVVQHTAARNGPPTAQCRAALAEVVAQLKSEPCQQHLRIGFRAIAQRARGELQNRQEAERLPIMRALRRAVGDDRYESLLQMSRGKSHDAPHPARNPQHGVAAPESPAACAQEEQQRPPALVCSRGRHRPQTAAGNSASFSAADVIEFLDRVGSRGR